MDARRIAELLHPFFATRSATAPGSSPRPQVCHSEPAEVCHSEPASAGEESALLSPSQLIQISTYIDLLLRWNARVNLTAIRDPESIVTRHFGESLFAARHLFPAHGETAPSCPVPHVADIGSGAGFPGLPIKIWAPAIHLTLIESNQKKSTFLREVVRALSLTDIDVFNRRAEDFPSGTADVLTLRAVERFETVLPVAARVVKPEGRLALLIGQAQTASAHRILPGYSWHAPIRIPLSANRILLVGSSPPEPR